MEMNELDELNEKLDFFCKQKVRVHIDLKDGIFLNGFILKNIKQDIWWMKEKKLNEIFLFTKSISKLQQFMEGGK